MKIFTLLSDKYHVEYTINLGLMLMCYMCNSGDSFGLRIVYNTNVTPLEDYVILGSPKQYPMLYEECHKLQMIIHEFLASDRNSVIIKDKDFCVR